MPRREGWYHEDAQGILQPIAPPSEESAEDAAPLPHPQELTEAHEAEPLDDHKATEALGSSTSWWGYDEKSWSIMVAIIFLSSLCSASLPAHGALPWGEFYHSFPLLLFSWERLSSLGSAGAMWIYHVWNVLALSSSAYALLRAIRLVQRLWAPSLSPSDHTHYGTLLVGAYLLASPVWHLLHGGAIQHADSATVLLLVASVQWVALRILIDPHCDPSWAVVAGLGNVMLICYDPVCSVLVLVSSVALMMQDMRRDPRFQASFLFIGSVGAFLVLVVIYLRLTGSPPSPALTQPATASLLRRLLFFWEALAGHLLSPSRGLGTQSILALAGIVASGIQFVQMAQRVWRTPEGEASDATYERVLTMGPLLLHVVGYIVILSLLQATGMPASWAAGQSSWQGWWGLPGTLGSAQLYPILPSVFLLCTVLPHAVQAWGLKRQQVQGLFVGLLLISLFMHTPLFFSGGASAGQQWEQRESYSCYPQATTNTSLHAEPFLVLSSTEAPLAQQLGQLLYVRHQVTSIHDRDSRYRLWSLWGAPIWSEWAGIFSPPSAEDMQAQWDAGQAYCDHQLHEEWRRHEANLRAELERLQSRTLAGPSSPPVSLSDDTATLPSSPNIQTNNSDILEVEIDTVGEPIPASHDDDHNQHVPVIELPPPVHDSAASAVEKAEIGPLHTIRFLYVGADGRYNRGDDIVFRGFQRFLTDTLRQNNVRTSVSVIRTFPTSDPALSPCNDALRHQLDMQAVDVLVLGGGSTIRDQFLCQLGPARLETQRSLPVLLWGSGFDDLLLLTSNRNIMRQLRAEDFSSISFLSSSKLVKSIHSLAEQSAVFGGVRGNYSHLFLSCMFDNDSQQAAIFPSLGEPGLLHGDLLPPSNALVKEILPNRPYVMINFGMASEGENHMYGKNHQSTGAVLDQLIADLAPRFLVVLYATHTADLKHIEALHSLATGMGVEEDRLLLLTRVPTETRLLPLLQHAHLSITFRYYATVLSAVADVPFVALAYRFKTIEFCDSIGRGDAVIPTDQLDYATLRATVERVLTQEKPSIGEVKDGVRTRFQERVDALWAHIHTPEASRAPATIAPRSTARVLYISMEGESQQRYLYEQVDQALAEVLWSKGQLASVEPLALHWPALRQWEVDWAAYDGVILAGLQFSHPALSYVLQSMPADLPVLMADCFPDPLPASMLAEREAPPPEQVWASTHPSLAFPTQLRFPVLLPSTVQSDPSPLLEALLPSGDGPLLLVYLSALESDFPYSDVSENLRLVSRWAAHATKLQQHVIIATSEVAALPHVQTLIRYIKTEPAAVDSFLHSPNDSWDVSLLRQLLQQPRMKAALTFSDLGSVMCVAESVPFVQLMTGDQSSPFLTLTGLVQHSATFRHLRSAQGLWELIDLALQEQSLQRVDQVRETHMKDAQQNLQTWSSQLLGSA